MPFTGFCDHLSRRLVVFPLLPLPQGRHTGLPLQLPYLSQKRWVLKKSKLAIRYR